MEGRIRFLVMLMLIMLEMYKVGEVGLDTMIQSTSLTTQSNTQTRNRSRFVIISFETEYASKKSKQRRFPPPFSWGTFLLKI
jgi:hypothetical protein